MLEPVQAMLDGGTLTDVLYWVIDRPRGAPWTMRSGAVQALDCGIDLVFASSVLGITWRQTRDDYALDLGDASVHMRHPTGTTAGASQVAPWATLVGSPLLGVHPAASLSSGEPWLLQLRFGAGTVYVAAATPLPRDDRLLPGVDEVLVFNSTSLAETYSSLAPG